jgi:hypothetical protein
MVALREAEAAQVSSFLRRWLHGVPAARAADPAVLHDDWERAMRAELRVLRKRFSGAPEVTDLLGVVASSLRIDENA